MADPGPHGGSISRDPVPQSGSPVASELTDPGARPPSRSGNARSSGPSGLREGGGAGNLSQRGTQRNRKGSPGWTKTTSRSLGHLRQSECSEDDGPPRGTFRVVGGAWAEAGESGRAGTARRGALRSCGSSVGGGSQLCSPRPRSRRAPAGRYLHGPEQPVCEQAVVSPSRPGMWTRCVGARNAESCWFPARVDIGVSEGTFLMCFPQQSLAFYSFGYPGRSQNCP